MAADYTLSSCRANVQDIQKSNQQVARDRKPSSIVFPVGLFQVRLKRIPVQKPKHIGQQTKSPKNGCTSAAFFRKDLNNFP